MLDSRTMTTMLRSAFKWIPAASVLLAILWQSTATLAQTLPAQKKDEVLRLHIRRNHENRPFEIVLSFPKPCEYPGELNSFAIDTQCGWRIGKPEMFAYENANGSEQLIIQVVPEDDDTQTCETWYTGHKRFEAEGASTTDLALFPKPWFSQAYYSQTEYEGSGDAVRIHITAVGCLQLEKEIILGYVMGYLRPSGHAVERVAWILQQSGEAMLSQKRTGEVRVATFHPQPGTKRLKLPQPGSASVPVAKEDSTPAIKAAPASTPTADYYFKQGIDFDQHGRMAESLKAFQEAAKLEPDNGEYQSRLGNAYQNANDEADAIAAYRRAIDLRNSADDLEALGKLLLQRGEFAESASLYEKAISLGHRYAWPLVNYAEALAGAKRPREAMQQMEAAVALEPDNPNIRARRDKLTASLPSLAGAKGGLQFIDVSTGAAFGTWERAPGTKTWSKVCEEESQPTACWLAGLSYSIQDHLGRRFLRKACDLGHAEACNDLGDRYRFGMLEVSNANHFIRFGPGPEDPERDFAMAGKFYEKACAGGSTDACISLAFLLEWGRGVARNPDRAKQILGNACKAGQLLACMELNHPLPAPKYNPPAGLTGGTCTSLESCSAACNSSALGNCNRMRYFENDYEESHNVHARGQEYLKGKKRDELVLKAQAETKKMMALIASACTAGLDWACSEIHVVTGGQFDAAGCTAHSGLACYIRCNGTGAWPCSSRNGTQFQRALAPAICDLGYWNCDLSSGDAIQVLSWCEMGIARACGLYTENLDKDPKAEEVLGRYTRNYIARLACNGGVGCTGFSPALPVPLSYAYALRVCNREGIVRGTANSRDIACGNVAEMLAQNINPAAEEFKYTQTLLKMQTRLPIDWDQFPQYLAQTGCQQKNGYACFALAEMFDKIPYHTIELPKITQSPEPVRQPDVASCTWAGSTPIDAHYDPERCRKGAIARVQLEHDKWERQQARIANQPTSLSYQDPKAKAAHEQFLHLACDNGQTFMCPLYSDIYQLW